MLTGNPTIAPADMTVTMSTQKNRWLALPFVSLAVATATHRNSSFELLTRATVG
jgi:hypothetical protein